MVDTREGEIVEYTSVIVERLSFMLEICHKCEWLK